MTHLKSILPVCILVLVLGEGCRTPGHVTDLRGASDVCAVHHVKMRSVQFPMGSGCALPYAGYLEARDNCFPNAFPIWLNSQKDYCIIYVCDDCIRAEDVWKKSH